MNGSLGVFLVIMAFVSVTLLLYSAIQRRRESGGQESAESITLQKESKRLLEDAVAWQRESKRMLEESVALQKETNRLLEQLVASQKVVQEKQTTLN